MRLKSLHIHQSYRDEKTLRGKVEFTSADGEITLRLDDQTSEDIVKVCADAIIRSAQEAAANMTDAIIDATGPKALADESEVP